MKKPQSKSIKAWAVVSSKGIYMDRICDRVLTFGTKQKASEYLLFRCIATSDEQVVPCKISYTIPNKKKK